MKEVVVIRPFARAMRFLQIDLLAFLLILPAVVMMTVLLFYPLSKAIQLSFYDIRLLDRSGGTFAGLENYRDVFHDENFWASVEVTVKYSVWVLAATYPIGLGTALLLNLRLPFRGLIRTLMIVPWAVPEVVAVLMFAWMYDAQYGVFNYFLLKAGLIDEPLLWLVQSHLALPAVIIVTIWKQFPLATLMLLAGLQTIPDELYEAASIDGANALQRFWHITWPGLRSINATLVLVLILFSFRRVTLIYTMTGGGPARATETLSIMTYRETFKYFHLGYASAVGTVLLLILLAFTLIYFRLIYSREPQT